MTAQPATVSRPAAAATTTTLKVQVAVRATPEQVWTALTDGAVTPAYYYGFVADFGDLRPGTGYRSTAGGGDMITGEVLEAEAARRLVVTFDGAWQPDVAALPTSTVTFELLDPAMPAPGVTLLSCVHEGLPAGETAAHLELGWVSILSGLKTLLETGQPMVAPPAG
jgi:uncharacterized protein YndB with AHSA1/START domain